MAGEGGAWAEAWVGALDGGGTKTATALADREGEVRILPSLPGCNPQDGPDWASTLRAALAGLAGAPGGLAAAVLGLPGWGEVPALDAAVAALARDALPAPFEALNDVILAHLGAFAGGEGVLVLAGTGSMAVAHGPRGLVRVGGWGDVIGDEGSAFWIGREGLSLAARALDGRAPGAEAFARALCGRLGATGDFGPLAWLMAQPGTSRAAAAGAAQAVDALAEEGGDPHARDIVARAAEHLADAAEAAARRAGLGAGFAWAEAGGAFRSSGLGSGVARRLGRPPDAPRLSALGGGLLRAAALAGWDVDAGWAARVDARLAA